MREYTDIGARIGVGLTTWWFPPMIRKGGRHVSPSDLAYEMRVTSPRDLAYEMRPPHAYHWALMLRVSPVIPSDTSPCDLAYEMRDTSLRDLAYETRVWDARHIPAWPRVWDATAARVSLGAVMRADNARVWHWSWSHFSAWWFPPMIRKGGRHIPAWPRVWDARHIPAWPCVWDATAARVSLGAVMRADNARVWHWSWSHFSAWWFPPMIRKGGRHIPAWPRVWDARHIPAWPCVWDATAARVSLGAARPIPIMTSRERHITRLTSLSNITTVAYTASRVRWERFRVYFCRAYKLFVETFCFVANANIITTVAYTASRVHWERFCVSFKTKSERTTCLLYNVLFCF